MVKHSLENLLDKYPFFFDKRPVSNFYKITKVYNENFKLMYNDLFRIYEGFHLNKKLLMWREQNAPYDYNMNFATYLPSLKSVRIYKNDILIFKEEYDEDEEIDEFNYVYSAKYNMSNVLRLFAYECTECKSLYFDFNLPLKCTNCGSRKYVPVDVYICSECGEIYFDSEEITDCTKYNHIGKLQKVNIYRCRNCGQVYFGENPPEVCGYCFEDEEGTIPTRLTSSSVGSNLSYNDNYVIDDNSVDYTEYGDNTLIVSICDNSSSENAIANVNVNLSCNNNIYSGVTNQYGVVFFGNLIDGEYKVDVTAEGYEDIFKSLNISDNVVVDNETEDVVVDNSLELVIDKVNDESVVSDSEEYVVSLPQVPTDKFVMLVETYDEYKMIKGYPENDYTFSEYEKLVSEGKLIPDIYDHDYTLDMIGALNNIPRKQYNIVDTNSELPYTEPPFNMSLTEDDYHYMKRMIEYTLRLWCTTTDAFNVKGVNSRDFVEQFNPVTLELWKMYGIDSKLVNREKYLVKVFDEEKHPFDETTGLVKCWTPEVWEHKDKFCDGSAVYGEYFFVNSSTVRPIRGENVDFTFMVLNSLGEPIDENYYVRVYKVDENGIEINLSETPIRDGKFRLSYRAIDLNKPTVVKFEAEYDNGLLLGVCKVVLNVRSKADWYVDESIDVANYVGDGSFEKPFNSLQEAIDNVNGGLNYICLMSDVEIKTPLIINYDTIITGLDKFTDANDLSTRYVPSITQKGEILSNTGNTQYRRDFFKLVGNKECRLVLSNLELKSGMINTFVSINYWRNSNTELNNFETVIIHGGSIRIDITPNQEEYYPFDYIDYEFKLKKRDNTPLANNKVEIYYKNNLLTILTTNNEGKCSYKFNLNELETGEYTLHLKNRSEEFFEADTPIVINADKIPNYSSPEINQQVKLEVHNYNVGDEFKLFSENGDLVKTVTVSSADEKIDMGNLSFGRYVYYSTKDNQNNSSVKEEWVVEHECLMTTLANKTFIKEIVFDDVNGELDYDTITLSANPKLGDLDNIVIGVTLSEDNTELLVSTFDVPAERLTDEKIKYLDAQELKNALLSVEFDLTEGKLKGEKLGEFW